MRRTGWSAECRTGSCSSLGGWEVTGKKVFGTPPRERGRVGVVEHRQRVVERVTGAVVPVDLGIAQSGDDRVDVQERVGVAEVVQGRRGHLRGQLQEVLE